MALCCCWLLYRWWLGRPRVYRCLGMVDSKQQQRKNSTPRCSLNTQQRQHKQHLFTTLMLVSTTPPRLQDYTKTYAYLSDLRNTEVFLFPELHRVTSPKRLSTTLRLPITILIIATTPRLQLVTPPKRSSATPKRPSTTLKPTAAHNLSPIAFFIVLILFSITGKYWFLFLVVNQCNSF
jgi:hypothetical protein